LSKINYKKLVGAYRENGTLLYTNDASEWFDMGLISKFGKHEADALKKANQRSHSEIFKEIFKVDSVYPEVFFDEEKKRLRQKVASNNDYFSVGINPYAGHRWKSKELPDDQVIELIKGLKEIAKIDNKAIRIFLFGYGSDRERLESIKRSHLLSLPDIIIPNTDSSYNTLMNIISELSYMFTSDSFALHLCNGLKVPFIAFFAPTSEAEIDTFSELSRKVRSHKPDYCSYRKDADNSEITANVLLKTFTEVFNGRF
jgi:heptosyltransferase-2